MRNPVKIINTVTGIEHSVNPNLLAYAKSDPSTFKIEYEEDDKPKPTKKLTLEDLKEMSIPDLRALSDTLECDKRSKDSMIDAILKVGR